MSNLGEERLKYLEGRYGIPATKVWAANAAKVYRKAVLNKVLPSYRERFINSYLLLKRYSNDRGRETVLP